VTEDGKGGAAIRTVLDWPMTKFSASEHADALAELDRLLAEVERLTGEREAIAIGYDDLRRDLKDARAEVGRLSGLVAAYDDLAADALDLLAKEHGENASRIKDRLAALAGLREVGEPSD
jgi:hypothetical protein